MSKKDQAVIHTLGLSKSYGTTRVLSALDLNIPANSIIGFLGPNGAGKSTTIKLLLGLAKPSSGSGTIFGLDIEKDSQNIRRRVGYLAQNPQFYEHLTAHQNLEFVARFFFKGPARAINERIIETLSLVGLADKADRPIRSFSGGERQRLGIAQAQINYPDLLILDEPAAALDPMGRRDVLEIMEKLRKYSTIFFSTHILDDVQRVSDRVIILNQGKLIAQGSVDELLYASQGLSYRMVIKGDVERTKNRLLQFSWISDVKTGSENEKTALQILVKDESLAEQNLLRQVLRDENTTVFEFARFKQNLEQVFLQMVEGEK